MTQYEVRLEIEDREVVYLFLRHCGYSDVYIKQLIKLFESVMLVISAVEE